MGISPMCRNALVSMSRDEGGYSNRVSDRGRETWRGISRVMHPNWPGWTLIDKHRTDADFPNSLDRDNTLVGMYEAFYYEEFWMKLRGDELPPTLASLLFRMGVLVGPGRAAEWLQKALNILNGKQSLWPDLKVDGDIGPTTLKALASFVRAHRMPAALMAAIVGFFTAHLSNIANNDETQEDNAHGWLLRASRYMKEV